MKLNLTKKFLADLLAMNLFSTVIMLGIETIVSGLTISQSIHVRLIAIPINSLTGRPYGVFRDWVFQKFNVHGAGQIKKMTVDVATFFLGQIPVYVTILFLSGASFRQIVTASGSVILFCSIWGRPYGIFLEFFRTLFGIKRNNTINSNSLHQYAIAKENYSV